MAKILMWKNRPFKDARPVILLTASNPQSLAYFKEQNPWAENMLTVHFGTEGTPILEDRSGPVHSVLGFNSPLPVYSGDDVTGQFKHITQTAAFIASRVRGPVWEVCADASFGFLAIGAASTGKTALALSDSPPGAPALVMADLFGVDVEVAKAPDPAIPAFKPSN